MDLPTVCILCGGPDWPTSVCTGILGLPLGEMLMGTLPVFFVILPTCLAGSLQLRAAEGGQWETLAASMLAACAFAQFAAALGAMYFIEQAGRRRQVRVRCRGTCCCHMAPPGTFAGAPML